MQVFWLLGILDPRGFLFPPPLFSGNLQASVLGTPVQVPRCMSGWCPGLLPLRRRPRPFRCGGWCVGPAAALGAYGAVVFVSSQEQTLHGTCHFPSLLSVHCGGMSPPVD